MKTMAFKLSKRKIEMPNFNWSESEQAQYTFKNEFGEIHLEVVTPFMPVSEISHEKLPIINDVLVSVDMAEQITLITENRRFAMSFCWPLLPKDRACYAIKYSCVNRGAVCRVEIIQFQTPNGVTAQQQIDDMAPKTLGPLTLT